MQSQEKISAFFEAAKDYKEELLFLREILLKTELDECLKWGIPVYTIKNKNVVGITGFKKYFGLWFYDGAFLLDEKSKLINANKEKTKHLRQWRFTSLDEVKQNASLIEEYLLEAIKNLKKGIIEKKITTKPLSIPEELSLEFSNDSALKSSFDKMKLSLQREFTEYISDAKKPETKQRRILKITPLILAGTGLNDKYRK